MSHTWRDCFANFRSPQFRMRAFVGRRKRCEERGHTMPAQLAENPPPGFKSPEYAQFSVMLCEDQALLVADMLYFHSCIEATLCDDFERLYWGGEP